MNRTQARGRVVCNVLRTQVDENLVDEDHVDEDHVDEDHLDQGHVTFRRDAT